MFLFSSAKIADGNWRGVLELNDSTDMPFSFSVSGGTIIIRNGEESVVIEEVEYRSDSVIIFLPVFDAEFRCRYNEDSLSGVFINRSRTENNVFPFSARRNINYRFSVNPSPSSKSLSGRYSVVFEGDDAESRNSVGIFRQAGNRVTGTILNVTGDYRYLDGDISNDTLRLSAFDGFHAFSSTAIVKGDSLTNGHYYLGKALA